jgi:alkaline phosphatase
MKLKSLLVASTMLVSTSAFAGSHSALPQADNDWFVAGQTTIAEIIARQANTGTAKNVILLVADGNGVGTNYAIRLYDGQTKGMLGEENILPYETSDWYSALVKTYNINAQTPDSAPTAGAMNSGVKQRFNLINLMGDAIHDDCSTVAGNEVAIMSEIATAMGKSVGVVSTARITHATPAAVYAKTANRDWEDTVPEGCTQQKDIAAQLIDAMEAGTIDFVAGGGSRYFFPKGMEVDGVSGHRGDDQNLLEKATEMGVQWAGTKDAWNNLSLDGSPVLALFGSSHMMYEADRTDAEPSVAEMTEAAIKALSNNENGFYLEIEAGRVDHANHAGNLARVVTDGVAFAEAVAVADAMTDDEDTLIIVTADHEHAIAFNGYCGRGSNILGLCYGVAKEGEMHADKPLLAADGQPYTVAGYLNGAGSVMREDMNWAGVRRPVTQEEAIDVDYTQQALIPMSSETHSGEDVMVYAKGPWAHLFDSTIEQNVIFHVMHHAISQ